MKKKILFSMLAIIPMACSLSSPFAAATPITQVVFRSPHDMNLQPADVHDLTERPVENPATSPLLPEAIDQDQRAYISKTQNIYVESDAIMVPERTKRTPADIVDQVVHKRRPKANIDKHEQPVSVGDSGTLVTINTFCSSNYNVGLVLIVIRNNMIVVLIGCGSDVTQNYLLHLGNLVDAHITAPPQPSEVVASSDILTTTAEVNSVPVANTPEITAVPLTGSPATLRPPECAQFNLTPEECINSGTHTYSYSGKTTAQAVLNACGMGPDDAHEWGGDQTEITTAFTSDALTLDPSHGSSFLIVILVFIQNNDSSGRSSIHFIKKAPNHYEYYDSSQYKTYTINFNSKGFEIKSRFEYQFTDGLGICEETETFTLVKP